MGLATQMAIAGGLGGMGDGIVENAKRAREDALMKLKREWQKEDRAETRKWQVEDRELAHSRRGKGKAKRQYDPDLVAEAKEAHAKGAALEAVIERLDMLQDAREKGFK